LARVEVRYPMEPDGRLATARAPLNGDQSGPWLGDELVLLLVEHRRDRREEPVGRRRMRAPAVCRGRARSCRARPRLLAGLRRGAVVAGWGGRSRRLGAGGGDEPYEPPRAATVRPPPSRRSLAARSPYEARRRRWRRSGAR